MKNSRSVPAIGCVVALAVFLSACSHFKNLSSDGGAIGVVDVNQRHPNDKRQFKEIILDNKLRVLLISDPNLNKSAAAMDVGVGSAEDPLEHQGLAHFLEHMLFLGTKKYPAVDEYNRYLQSYQGEANAYTAADHTNFFFEVNHDGFDGAIDRFAQFFIAPTMNPEYVDRERHIVFEEHRKNIQDDNWRLEMLARSLYKDGHKLRKFSTGNLETLGKAEQSVLINFYKEHYSANQMRLVLMNTKSLAELEKIARYTFTAVPNSNRSTLSIDSELFTESARKIEVQSVKDLRKLVLMFGASSSEKYYKSKPAVMISHLLGHEGEGSLLSLLKKKNLATSLSAGLFSTSYSGVFQFEISLTENGLSQVEHVISLFFSYVEMLKTQGYQHYIYSERKAMEEINFFYADPKEGMAVAANYAAGMLMYPGEDIDKNNSLLMEYSPEDFNLFLSYLQAKKLNAFVLSRQAKTDLIEPYYGTHYKVSKFMPEQILAWEKSELNPELKLPAPNEFIPKKLEIIAAGVDKDPQKIIDKDYGVLWFKADSSFLLPKGYISLLLLSKRVNSNAKENALSLLYSLALQEGLNEWKYEVNLAGMDYTIGRTHRGISLDFSGYSENLTTLVTNLVAKLKDITIDENRLEAIKDAVKRGIQNAKLDAAYQQVMYEIRYESSQDVIHQNELFDLEKGIDLISPVTLNDLQTYGKEIFANIAFEGSAFGNLHEEQISAAVDSVLQVLDSKPIPKANWPKSNWVRYKKGKPYVRLLQSSTNNYCFGEDLQIGRRDLRLNAIVRVGYTHLRSSFFTELRTKQQLGYVVQSALNLREKSLGLLFLVQSEKINPYDIDRRVSAWKKQAVKEIAEMTDKEFNAYLSSITQDLIQPEKTMEQKHHIIAYEALALEGEFHYKRKVAAELRTISKEDVYKVFADAFSKENEASLAVFLLSKNGVKSEKSDRLEMKDVSKFRREAETF